MNKTAPWYRAFASRHRPARPDRRPLSVYRGRVVSVADRVTSTTVSGPSGYTSVNSVPEVWITDAEGQELRFRDHTLADCRTGHEVVIVFDTAKNMVLSMRNLSTGESWISRSLDDLPVQIASTLGLGGILLPITWVITLIVFGEPRGRTTLWEQNGPTLFYSAAMFLAWWIPHMDRQHINHRNEALRVRITQELEAASK